MSKISFGILKKYVRVLDELLNTNVYLVKFMVHDVIDSYTGGPVATICVIRDITDYDQPVDYVLVEHWQGQWLGTALYVNMAWRNDYGYFCVLSYEDGEEFLKEIVSYLKQVAKSKPLDRGDLHDAMEKAIRKFHKPKVRSLVF